MNSTISIKAKYHHQFRRLRIRSDVNLSQLLENLSQLFQTKFDLTTHSIKYVDDEKDEITVEVEEEWQEAIRISASIDCLKMLITDKKKQQESPQKTTTTTTRTDAFKEFVSDVQQQLAAETVKEAICEATNTITELVHEVINEAQEFTIELDPMGPDQVKMYYGAPNTQEEEEKPVEKEPQPEQQIVEPVVVQKQPEIVVKTPEAVPAIPNHMEQSWTFVEVNNKELDTKPIPAATFVRDLSVPDTTQIIVGSIFTKAWAIKNTGSFAWPEGTTLQYIDGPQNVILSMNVPLAKPEQEVAVSVTIKTPGEPGKYKGYFKLMTSDKVTFGHTFWFEIEAIRPLQPTPVPLRPVNVPMVQPTRPIYPQFPQQQFVPQQNFVPNFPRHVPPPQQPRLPEQNQPIRMPNFYQPIVQQSQGVQSHLPPPVVQPPQQPIVREAPVVTSPPQPPKWESQLRLLSEMGFDNREALIPLLDKHNGDLTAVVHAYISL